MRPGAGARLEGLIIFLHADFRRERLALLLFAARLVLVIVRMLWILYHLYMRMMKPVRDAPGRWNCASSAFGSGPVRACRAGPRPGGAGCAWRR